MLKIVVFVSGRGSNLGAILNSIPSYLNNVEVVAVVSNAPECPALELARVKNIPTYSVKKQEQEGFVTYSYLISIFSELQVGLIVLAGFLKKIPDKLVELYENKIINIHPALLPSFGGKGMYGMNVHTTVFNTSCQVSGASIHFVDKFYDEGKIIAQKCIDITDVQTPAEIAKRVLKIEHQLLPFVIKKFSENQIHIKNNRVFITD